MDTIINIQKIYRGYKSRKNNIYYNLKKNKIKTNFRNEVIGYHIICKEPIKESKWEEIDVNILKQYHNIHFIANGKHNSGLDIIIDKWNISNKTSKIDKNNNVNISSYRLTSVCNNLDVGNKEEIINEINNRDKSYDYYSILLRKENNNIINYYWCIIPKNNKIFNINNNILFIPKYSTKNNEKQIGWKSQYFDITFSLSSQLWFHFKFEDIKRYIICQVEVNLNVLPKITYSDILTYYQMN